MHQELCGKNKTDYLHKCDICGKVHVKSRTNRIGTSEQYVVILTSTDPGCTSTQKIPDIKKRIIPIFKTIITC